VEDRFSLASAAISFLAVSREIRFRCDPKRGRGRRAEFVEVPISNMRKLVCAHGKLFFNLWEDLLEEKVLSDDPPCGQQNCLLRHIP
jgi:hypothetical protein